MTEELMMKEELERKIGGIQEEMTNLRRLRNRISNYSRSWEAVKSKMTTYAASENKDVAEAVKVLETAYEGTGDKDIAEAIKFIDNGLHHLGMAEYKLKHCLSNIENKINEKKSEASDLG